MALGTVKWFNFNKGFGFIEPATGGKDIFVHITELQKAGISDLKEGTRVSYEIATDKGKEKAVNLKLFK